MGTWGQLSLSRRTAPHRGGDSGVLMLPVGELGRAWKLLLLKTSLRLCLVCAWLQTSQTWEWRLAAVALTTEEQDFTGGLSLVLLLLYYTEFLSANPFLLLWWGLATEPVAQGYSLLSLCMGSCRQPHPMAPWLWGSPSSEMQRKVEARHGWWPRLPTISWK